MSRRKQSYYHTCASCCRQFRAKAGYHPYCSKCRDAVRAGYGFEEARATQVIADTIKPPPAAVAAEWRFIGETLSREQPRDVEGQEYIPGFAPQPTRTESKRGAEKRQGRLW